MYILTQDGARKGLYPLKENGGAYIKGNSMKFVSKDVQSLVVNESDSDKLSARLDDIVEALKADVLIYDTSKDIGHWKEEEKKETPKPKTATRKTTRKAEPKAE